jgi:hypothetical protein
LWIAEELGDADQESTKQRLDFIRGQGCCCAGWTENAPPQGRRSLANERVPWAKRSSGKARTDLFLLFGTAWSPQLLDATKLALAAFVIIVVLWVVLDAIRCVRDRWQRFLSRPY